MYYLLICLLRIFIPCCANPNFSVHERTETKRRGTEKRCIRQEDQTQGEKDKQGQRGEYTHYF